MNSANFVAILNFQFLNCLGNRSEESGEESKNMEPTRGSLTSLLEFQPSDSRFKFGKEGNSHCLTEGATRNK